MQIKTTIRYNFVSIRMSIIKKIRHSTCRHGYGEKGTLVCCWWDCKLAQTLGKIIWRFFKKLKTKLLCGPAVPLRWVYPKEWKTLTHKRRLWLCVHSSVIYNSQKRRKQPRCPFMDEWINKMQSRHRKGILFSLQKKGDTDLCYSIDEQWGHHTTWN